MSETPATVPAEKAPKPKWFEAAQLNAVKWLDEHADKYMLVWQLKEKVLAVDCYTMIPKGSRETEKIIFTYSKDAQVMSVYRSLTSEAWI